MINVKSVIADLQYGVRMRKRGAAQGVAPRVSPGIIHSQFVQQKCKGNLITRIFPDTMRAVSRHCGPSCIACPTHHPAQLTGTWHVLSVAQNVLFEAIGGMRSARQRAQR